MKILSLDLSSKSTGYAVFNVAENRELLEYGAKTAAGKDPILRIKKIMEQLKEVILKHKDIEIVVMEEVRPEEISQSQISLHTHKILMYVQAAAVFLIKEELPKAEVKYIYPSEWRKACSIKTGYAVKRDMQKQYDIDFVKQTFNMAVDDDTADAIGVGVGYIKKEGN